MAPSDGGLACLTRSLGGSGKVRILDSVVELPPCKGHDNAHMAKQWPDRSSLRLEAPLKSLSAIDTREASSPVAEGARGEMEGLFIAKKYEVFKCVRHEHGRMHYAQ